MTACLQPRKTLGQAASGSAYTLSLQPQELRENQQSVRFNSAVVAIMSVRGRASLCGQAQRCVLEQTWSGRWPHEQREQGDGLGRAHHCPKAALRPKAQ